MLGPNTIEQSQQQKSIFSNLFKGKFYFKFDMFLKWIVV